MHTQHNVGVAEKIGKYSDGIEVPAGARWLMTSGTPGVDAEGVLPADFALQATLAWENMLRLLAAAGMGVEDIVKITQTLTRREDLEVYRPIRSKFLGESRPASMLSFVSELIWPEVLFELEVVAAK